MPPVSVSPVLSPLVSVLMPVWNARERHFRDAVESVLRQTTSGWELVIVEDPSTTSVAPWLADYCEPRIRYFANPVRSSLVEQRNRTLFEARGHYVAVLDADDVCEPRRLEEQLAFLEADSSVDLVGSQITIIDDVGRTRGRRDYPRTSHEIHAALPRYNPLAHSTVVCRRRLLLEHGGYQYSRHAGVEDYELWRRLARAGIRFANLPSRLVRYRIQPRQLKARRLHEQLRGTLAVKRIYWEDGSSVRSYCRFALESGLQWLPAPLVSRLFLAAHLRSHAETDR